MAIQFFWIILVGLTAGIGSGLFGIGGGVIIVPSLMLLLNLPQASAVGTSLVAMLLPVGALSVYKYYEAGKITSVHFKYGLLLALGLFLGGFLGAKLALYLPEKWCKRFFALFLVFVAYKLWPKN